MSYIQAGIKIEHPASAGARKALEETIEKFASCAMLDAFVRCRFRQGDLCMKLNSKEAEVRNTILFMSAAQ